MPWTRTDWMSERLKFVATYLEHEVSVTDLCHDFGVSRKTGYKWIERYLRQGPAGLEERSRRPRRSPNQTAEEIVTAILDYRFPLTVTDGFSRYLLAAKR